MRTRLFHLGLSLLSACGGTEQMAGMDPDPTEMSPDAGMDAEPSLPT